MRPVVYACLIWASVWIAKADPAPVATERPPPPDIEFPFPVGEKLTYTIYWGWIAVGESVATTEWVWGQERWRLRIRFLTTSNGVLSALYPVDDLVETLVDPETLRPLVFHMNLNQGDRHRHETTRFDWDNLQAHYIRKREDREDEVKTYPIRPDTRDIVSFMYFMRTEAFEPDSTYEFEVMSDEKLYDLTVKIRDEERIRLDTYGRVPSLRMDPIAEFQGMVNRRGKMRVWLSTGGRQLLTKVFVDTPFANVRLLLKSVEGPGAETWQTEERK